MKFIRNFFPRWRYSSVIKKLPYLLQKRFGGSEFYTPKQVIKTAKDLRLSHKAVTYALAAFCEPHDFKKARPGMPAQNYQKLREELADLFNLDEQDLNGKKLARKFIPQFISTPPERLGP